MSTVETTGSGPILVYGATGAQGRPVVDALLRSGYRVRGVSRSLIAGQPSDGYETAHVDLGDRGSIDAATAGIGGVFLHLPNVFDVDLAMAFLRNAVAAAEAAGARRLVFTTSSGAPAEPTEIAMFEIRRIAQDYLASSALDVTVIRPTVYTDSLAQPYLWQAALHQGVWLWPYLPDHRVSWISARDQGRIVAAAFGLPGAAGVTYDIGGPPVSGAEFAAMVGSVLGREVAYVPVEPDAFEANLRGFIGPVAAKAVSDVYRWHREHGTEPVQVDDPGVAEREFGVGLTPLDTDLRTLASASGAVGLAESGFP